jgi:hypothetical protein
MLNDDTLSIEYTLMIDQYVLINDDSYQLRIDSHRPRFSTLTSTSLTSHGAAVYLGSKLVRPSTASILLHPRRDPR